MKINGMVSQLRDGDSVILDATFLDDGQMVSPAQYLYDIRVVPARATGITELREHGGHGQCVLTFPTRTCLIIRH